MDSVGRIGSSMDAADMNAADGAESGRVRKRDSLFMSARLTIDPHLAVRDVRVRNLSAGGLMAEYERPVATGTPVTLEMRGLGELTGRVAWCTDGRLGIALTARQQAELLAFLQTLTDADLLTNPRYAPPLARGETN